MLPNGMKGRYEIFGLETNAKYWYERMTDFPDVTFTIKDVQIKINSDEDGVILCMFDLMGTQIIPSEPVPEVNAIAVIDENSIKPVYIFGEVDQYHDMASSSNNNNHSNKNNSDSSSSSPFSTLTNPNNYHQNTMEDFDTITSTNNINTNNSMIMNDFGIQQSTDIQTLMNVIEHDDDDLVDQIPNKLKQILSSASIESKSLDHHHHLKQQPYPSSPSSISINSTISSDSITTTATTPTSSTASTAAANTTTAIATTATVDRLIN
jgi:hypothetical protein